jgi:hypothetical protein
LHWLLGHGADLYIECRIGVYPFMEAAVHAPVEIVRLFHSYGARAGNTAHSAAESSVPGWLNVLRFLLDIGAHIDAIEFEHNACGLEVISTLEPHLIMHVILRRMKVRQWLSF